MNSFMPLNEAILTPALEIFLHVSVVVSGFVSCIFILRMCYLVGTVGSAAEYGDLLKDLLMFFALISLFPILIKLVIYGLADLSEKISFNAPDESIKQIEVAFDNLFSDFPLLTFLGRIGFVMIQKIAESIFTSLMTLLIAIAPVFIFTNTILNLQSGIRGYFVVFLSLGIWPVVWNVLGKLALILLAHSNSSSFETSIFWLSTLLLQLCSPFFSYTLFQSMSVGGGISKAKSLVLKMGGF